MTSSKARDWFSQRLRNFQREFDIDSFKFDAGETTWLPLGGATERTMRTPNEYSREYVDMVAQFGDMIEVRVGSRTQKYSPSLPYDLHATTAFPFMPAVDAGTQSSCACSTRPRTGATTTVSRR